MVSGGVGRGMPLGGGGRGIVTPDCGDDEDDEAKKRAAGCERIGTPTNARDWRSCDCDERAESDDDGRVWRSAATAKRCCDDDDDDAGGCDGRAVQAARCCMRVRGSTRVDGSDAAAAAAAALAELAVRASDSSMIVFRLTDFENALPVLTLARGFRT